MASYQVVEVRTRRRNEMVDVTRSVAEAVRSSGIDSGLVMVYSPHTTGAITVNEGADPDVRTDVLTFLEATVPRDPRFKHAEGNSDSHIKTILVGPSELVAVEEGDLVLGTWQRIFFCEFDGPRSRRIIVKTVG